MRVVNNLPRFSRTLYNVLDDALLEGARDILIKSKERAPFKQGALRSQSETHRVKFLHQRVSYWVEYARFQEMGGDGLRRIRNYTSPGTGKGFLKKSGNEVADRINMTLAKHARRAR